MLLNSLYSQVEFLRKELEVKNDIIKSIFLSGVIVDSYETRYEDNDNEVNDSTGVI